MTTGCSFGTICPVATPVSRLMVVDDDLEVHRLIRTMLKRGEYALQAFFDPVKALESARESAPDLVISDVMMPMMDGWTFVKSLRSIAPCAFIPVIFLTTANTTEDYIRGFRLGADDYLDKTSEFWNLAERVEKALARRREIETTVRLPKPDPTGSLKGKFDQVGLASLLTVLDLGKRSGILRVRRDRPADEGVLYVVKGRVHRADLDRRREVGDRDAIYELLAWSNGTYEFSTEKLRVADQVEMTTAELLLEGARRIDERRPRP